MPKYLDSSGVAYLWGKLKNDLNDKMVYYSRTKEEWDSDIETISQKDVLYIYSDYKTIQKDGKQIFLPGIKIGDGTSYLIDMPFINDSNPELEQLVLDHINNTVVHIQPGERDFWNNKLNYSLDIDRQNLTLNRL